MLQLLPKSSALTPKTSNPDEVIEIINSYIEQYHCENMSVDISYMNVLDACFVTSACSTKHFIKYPEGKINWIISSELIKEFNENLELGNINYIL